MKLNTFNLSTFKNKSNIVTFVINSGYTLEDVLALDGQKLVVYDSKDNEYAVFDNYVAVSIKYNNEAQIIAEFARKLDDDTAGAIENIDQNLSILRSKINSVESNVNQVNNSLSAKDNDHDQALGELGVSTAALLESNTQLTAANADVLQAIGELGAMVAAMQVSPGTPSHESGETA